MALYRENNGEWRRELPADPEIEFRMLSSALIRGGEAMPIVMSKIKAEDLSREEYRVIYRAMCSCYEKHGYLDKPLVYREMKNLPKGEICWSILMQKLSDVEITNAYIENYMTVTKENSILRQVIDWSETILWRAYEEKDPTEEILSSAAELLYDIQKDYSTSKKGIGEDTTVAKYLRDEFDKKLEELHEYSKRKTGFEQLDQNQIFAPGLYVLGGLPSLGKTTFAWQLLYQLAEYGNPCFYCSYEMSDLELITKTLSSKLFNRRRGAEAGDLALTAAQIRKGDSNDTLKEVIQAVIDSHVDIRVLELQNENIDTLLLKLRAYCRDIKKSPIICLDYLQIIPTKKDTAKSGVDEIVRKLKDFQRETNSTFIVISSFNRTNYNQPVAFESFKESGNIEYSADVVWGLQYKFMEKLDKADDVVKVRAAMAEARKHQPREIQLVCLKNRNGGLYTIDLKYYSAHDYFEEMG